MSLLGRFSQCGGALAIDLLINLHRQIKISRVVADVAAHNRYDSQFLFGGGRIAMVVKQSARLQTRHFLFRGHDLSSVFHGAWCAIQFRESVIAIHVTFSQVSIDKAREDFLGHTSKGANPMSAAFDQLRVSDQGMVAF